MANENKVIVTKSKLDALADSISAKTSESLPMTITQMKDAVDRIDTSGGGITPTGTKQISITTNGTVTEDVMAYANAEISVNVVNQDYEDALVALGTQSDLTDSIEALTTYSNDVTGESDTTLSDAVHTLADGYGQGGDTFEGLRLVSADSNTGRPTSYKWEGDTIPAYGLKYCYYGTGNGQRCTIDLSNVEYVKQYALDCSGLEPINTLNIKEMDSYALSLRQTINANDLRSKTLNLENYTGYGIGKSTNVNSVFRSGDNTNYFGTILCPKIEHVPTYAFCNVKSNMTIQFGSIGFPVRTVGQRPFLNATGTNTITVYTTGSLLDTVKTAVENSAETNTTFIYKASEATTYNGTEYAAGDTMLTTTP